MCSRTQNCSEQQCPTQATNPERWQYGDELVSVRRALTNNGLALSRLGDPEGDDGASDEGRSDSSSSDDGAFDSVLDEDSPSDLDSDQSGNDSQSDPGTGVHLTSGGGSSTTSTSSQDDESAGAKDLVHANIEKEEDADAGFDLAEREEGRRQAAEGPTEKRWDARGAEGTGASAAVPTAVMPGAKPQEGDRAGGAVGSSTAQDEPQAVMPGLVGGSKRDTGARPSGGDAPAEDCGGVRPDGGTRPRGDGARAPSPAYGDIAQSICSRHDQRDNGGTGPHPTAGGAPASEDRRSFSDVLDAMDDQAAADRLHRWWYVLARRASTLTAANTVVHVQTGDTQSADGGTRPGGSDSTRFDFPCVFQVMGLGRGTKCPESSRLFYPLDHHARGTRSSSTGSIWILIRNTTCYGFGARRAPDIWILAYQDITAGVKFDSKASWIFVKDP
eukprot:SAG11_NODE_2414_length_3390_cov_10.587967_2_plen_444_part_00